MITVAIVDNSPIYLHGLADVIEKNADLRLVLTAESVEEFDERIVDTPRVVLLDLHLGGLSGHYAVGHLCDRGLSVLVISADSTEFEVGDAMDAGASGYLTKHATEEEIIGAINIAAGGGVYVSPRLAGYFLKGRKLTAREREILRMVAAGERNRDIAAALCIQESSVAGHLERITRKTGRPPRRWGLPEL